MMWALSLLFRQATLAWAGEPGAYSPRIVPNCTRYRLSAGTEVCGFEKLSDWKLVLDADSELWMLRAKELKNEAIIQNLTLQVTNLEGQVTFAWKAIDAVKERNATLTKQLIDLDEKYQNERVKPTWGNPLAWTITAISCSVLAGFLLAEHL